MVAGRGISMADHRRPDHHRQQRLVQRPRLRLRADAAARVPHRRSACFVLTALLTRRTALGMLIEAVGINPEASRLAGVRVPHDHLDRLRVLRPVRRPRRPGHRRQHQLGQRQQPRPVDRARRDPRRRHRRHVAGRRPVLAGRHAVGALFIATLARTIPNIGIPSEVNYLFKAVVVIAVCLLQSPKARAVLRVRRSGERPTAPVLAKAGSPA